MGLVHRGGEAIWIREASESFAPGPLMRDASRTPSTSKMAAVSVWRYSDLGGTRSQMLMMLEVQAVAPGMLAYDGGSR
jgi:hypothetical protein